jgi:4a-hydroxytetrahydrobiopterin dehydratase
MTTWSRGEASAAVSGAGWRYLLGTYATSVTVASIAEAAEVAASAMDAADGRLRLDLRAGRVELCVTPAPGTTLGPADAALALAVTTALDEQGWATRPDLGAGRPVQQLEIAIDAIDIPPVRAFWRAVMGYVDDADGAIVDPVGQGPAIWFQQMDAPRPQRNRIHLDVTVAHEEAEPRVAATIAAGGRLLSDKQAPAFWVLADPEGNEACVCTWQGRD